MKVLSCNLKEVDVISFFWYDEKYKWCFTWYDEDDKVEMFGCMRIDFLSDDEKEENVNKFLDTQPKKENGEIPIKYYYNWKSCL